MGGVERYDAQKVKSRTCVPGGAHCVEECCVLQEAPICKRRIDTDTVRWDPASSTQVKMAHLGVTNSLRGHPYRLARSAQDGVRIERAEPIHDRCARRSD